MLTYCPSHCNIALLIRNYYKIIKCFKKYLTVTCQERYIIDNQYNTNKNFIKASYFYKLMSILKKKDILHLKIFQKQKYLSNEITYKC